jgi:hypothetical protein
MLLPEGTKAMKNTSKPLTERSALARATILLLPLVIATAGCCKKNPSTDGASPDGTPAAAAALDGSAWAGVYTRYGEAVRKDGKKITSATSAGQATLTMATGQVTYVVEYPSGKATHKATQVYTFTPADVTQVKNGHNVQLTWQSLLKEPTNSGYLPDKIEPMLKIRGDGDKRHIELEFTDTQGVRADIDFSVGGVDLKKAKLDDDFE